MKTRARFLTPLMALAALLLAIGLIAGCGGSGDSTSTAAEADPQTVLDTALGSGGDPIASGVLDLSFKLASPGSQAQAVDATLQGPFQSNGDGKLPSIDFTVKANADVGGPSLGIDGGLTLTPDGLFVNYSDSDYALDDATFQMLVDSYEQSAQLQADQGDSTGSLSQLGIDPSTWLTDVTNEGVEDLGGTQVVHISGTPDVGKIVSDLGSAAEKSGQAGQLDPSALQQLEQSVQSASIDVFADAGDNTLRKLDLSLDITDPTGSGGGTTSVDLSFGIADPNSPQEIAAPANAKPLADLLSQFPGAISSLGGLGAASGSGSASSADPAPAPPAPAPSGGGGGSAGGGASAQGDAYFQCVQSAQSPADVSQCAKLLN